MIRKTRLFTPGPTPLLPAAQFAMAAADIHHRTAEFRALYTRVLAQLKDFVGTTNDVLILSASGSGAMEASVSNLTSPGEVRFDTEASIAPVPELASSRTSFLVPTKTLSWARTLE